MKKVESNEERSVRKNFEKQEYSIYLESIPDSPKTSSSIIVYGDGEYLLRQNSIGKFFGKTSARETPSLEDGPDSFFTLDLPKIDPTILQKQVSFYREVMKLHQNSEAYTLILWDKQESKYIVTCPEQKVSGATVVYNLDMSKFPSSRYVQVVSCHSHNSMGAFFSSVDDADEQADMLYMVLGRLDSLTPEYSIRANLKGKQIAKLELEDLFEIDSEEFSELSQYWDKPKYFPKSWIGNVVKLERPSHQATRIVSTKFNSGMLSKPWFSTLNARQEKFSFFNEAYESDAVQSILNVLRSSSNLLYTDTPEDVVRSLIRRISNLGFANIIDDVLAEIFSDDQHLEETELENNFMESQPSRYEEFEEVNSFLQNQMKTIEDETLLSGTSDESICDSSQVKSALPFFNSKE
jgi:hypothetical protein